MGGFSFCGMPAIFAINGVFSPFVTQAAGVMTCLASIIMAGATMYLVLGRNPFAMRQEIGASMRMGSANAASGM